MIALVEAKIKWNVSAFESVARAFDDEAKSARGDKGVCVTAAMLMYLTQTQADRQRYVDIVKLAEGRGVDGTVLDAAKKITGGEAEDAEAVRKAREHHTQAEQAASPRGRRQSGT